VTQLAKRVAASEVDVACESADDYPAARCDARDDGPIVLDD